MSKNLSKKSAKYMDKILKNFGRFFVFSLAFVLLSFSLISSTLPIQAYAESTPVVSVVTASRTLKLSMTGDDVKALQTFLNDSGYNCGIADGIFGPKTEAQVKLFQKDNNLTPDGIIGQRTRAILNQFNSSTPTTLTVPNVITPVPSSQISTSLDRTLKLNMQGDDVKSLQIFLNTHGFPVALSGVGSLGHETTTFGPLTKKAVILFQKANNLIPDGIVGKITRSLISTTSVSNPQGTLYISGCNGKTGFSPVTGVSCGVTSLPIGCNSSSIYSISTGLSCATGLPPASPFRVQFVNMMKRNTVINTPTIAGITVPEADGTPTSSITATDEYTATISWTDSPTVFTGNTEYTATITITPKSGYTLNGVTANYFTVSGATATNSANSGVITAVFPATPKADVSAPSAPTEASKTATSITLTAMSGNEFRNGSGAWQSSEVFTSLTPLTSYTFTARVKETSTTNASLASVDSLSITTDADVPVMTGSVAISGTEKFDQVLTATPSLTYTPTTSDDVPTYQWKRGVTNIGTNSSTYTLVEADITNTITVTVTADGVHSTGNVTSSATGVIAKADVSAPSAPTEASKTATSITLTAMSGNEFRNGSGAWQSSEVFTSLTPLTSYTFTARVKETSTTNASLASVDSLSITTDALGTQATPTFSPDSEAITLGVTPITITSAGGDNIYYTTDGTTPTTGSPFIATGGTITLASVSNPIKAYAVKSGYTDSAVGTSGTYTQSPSADLTGMVISGSPANYTFGASTYTYNGVTVLNAVASITITPTGTGTITVDGATVASGSPSDSLSLTEGVEKTILVVVTETGKSSKTYTINVTRAVAITPLTAIGVITGTTTVGSVLTAGALTPAEATVTYQWKSASTSGGTYTDIPSATARTYTLVSTDLGNYIKVSATGTGSYSGTVTSTTTAVILATFTYNGGSFTYGIVTNPTTGKTWLDRNLGASQVATSSTDSLAYGDLFQWGRTDDGHQLRGSTTTGTLSTSDDTTGNASFILSPNTPYDWRSDNNTNRWNATPMVNNVCPSGFRIPLDTELDAERASWVTSGSTNNSAGAFASPLKLTVAGSRGSSSGSLDDVGTNGYYWSSSIGGTVSRSLLFYSSAAGMSSGNRAYGRSVRCIKN